MESSQVEHHRHLLVKMAGSLLVALLVGAGVGYWYGQSVGRDAGYAVAQTDAKALQEEATNKALDNASKVANPFQAVNPLESVEANPFEKAQKALNPFE